MGNRAFGAGAPMWLSLVISAIAVMLSLYVVLRSLVVVLWTVFVSIVACATYGVTSGIFFATLENAFAGLAVISAGVVCTGLAIFIFFGCKVATKGIIWLTQSVSVGIKKCFIKKESL